MTITLEQIAAAKLAYEQAQEAHKVAAKLVTDLVTSHASTVKAYQDAKAAHDALRPATEIAKAKLKMAEGAVTVTRAEYQAVAPKEVAAENAAKKGTGNAALLTAVNTFLAGKESATNAEIYDGLVSAGVEMAGADPRSNLNSYLARWGTAGALESKGVGVWAAKTITPAAPQTSAPSFLTPPSEPTTEQPQTTAPAFLAPSTEQAPASDDLPTDFPMVEALKEAGYTTKASLSGKTVEELVQIPGIGAKSAEKIVAALAA